MSTEFYCEDCGHWLPCADDEHGCKFAPPPRRTFLSSVIEMFATVLLILAFMLAGAAILSMGGCSAKLKIANAAAEVAARATSATGHIDAAISTGEVGPAALPHLDAAKDDIAVIGEQAAVVTDALPGVKDTGSPWWLTIIIITAPLSLVCFLVWRFWPVISVFVGWIPAVFRRRAEPIADFIADPTPVTDADVPTIRAIERAKADPRMKVAIDDALTARKVVS